MSTRVEIVSLTKVKPYWRNPRENTKAIEKVKESIKMYGYNQYIVADEDLVIIAGHSRYKALVELGMTEVPIIIADLDKEKAKEYRIADNKTNEFAEWNYGDLMVELREMQDIGNLQKIFNEDLSKLIESTVNDGKEFTALGGDKIKEMDKEMNTRFEDISGLHQSNIVDVTCPHCGESFGINKSEEIWNKTKE